MLNLRKKSTTAESPVFIVPAKSRWGRLLFEQSAVRSRLNKSSTPAIPPSSVYE
jgi:hypothetical protein